MLVIRNEQVAALSADRIQRFERRMADYLRGRLPEATRELSEQQLRDRVSAELNAAQSYGISAERDLALYLVLSIMHGDGFLEQRTNEWMKAYLEDPQVPSPSERVNRLYQAVLNKLEQEESNRRAVEEYAGRSRSANA